MSRSQYLGTTGPNGLTRGECKKATGRRKGSACSGVREMPRNREFQSVAFQREPASRCSVCDEDNLLYSGGRRVYKGAHVGGQNGNPGLKRRNA